MMLLKKHIIFLFLIMGLYGCTEEFIPSTENFEDLLVVETTITDEFKFQKIKLTNTYTFEDTLVRPVTNAKVFIKDDLNQEYLFQYKEEDTAYLSIEKFKAESNKSYQLHIETAAGEKYKSTQVTLPPISNVDLKLSAQDVDGEFGATYKVSNESTNNDAIYYRYEYQEAYKVIAPDWGPVDGYIYREPPYTENYFYIYYLPREEQNRVCYTVKKSKEIIIANTNNQIENNVEDLLIKFYSQDNWRIAHRYALKVEQYVENLDAYNYYKNLKKISGNTSNSLSPTQPGYIEGNIQSVTSDRKVLGYFDVASYSSERIFFNYDDLFPHRPKPNYYIDCNVEKLDRRWIHSRNPPPEAVRLSMYISSGVKSVFKVFPDYLYWVVEPPCTKCTSISSNEIPDFWYE